MRRRILLAALLLLVTAPPVRAAGFNLAWDQCLNGGGARGRLKALYR